MTNLTVSPLLSTSQAARLIKQGQVIAFPTETVYGIGADATNDKAVQKIFQIKNRPENNPLIVHVASAQVAPLYVEWDLRAQQLADAFWPGPLTMILGKRQHSAISPIANANLDTVAIRVPNHPVALELLQKAERPIAAPSANISGTLSPTLAEHVLNAFSGNIPVLEAGPTDLGLESTVIDLTETPAVILRPGALTKERLETLIHVKEREVPKGPHKSPGQLPKHYAPDQPVRLNATTTADHEALLNFGPNKIVGAAKTLNLSPDGDLEEAAANLYNMLHELDHPQFAVIAVAPIPNIGIGVAINDRLKRAAAR